MSKEEILEFLNFRHACKIFDSSKRVKKEDFELILESARLSPSSFGFEPWRFYVLESKEIRKKLLPIVWGAQDTLLSSSYYVVILARKKPSMLYNSSYITHMLYDIHKIPKEKAEARRAKYKKFQEDDFKLLQSDRAIFDWACKQTYIALANMMSVAAMLKIDSCAIEGFDMQKCDELLSKELGYNQDEFGLSVMVAFGYRLNPQPTKTRQPLKDIVKFV
jgi:nitroreductase